MAARTHPLDPRRERPGIRRGLIALVGLMILVGAAFAWLRLPLSAEAEPQAYLEVRLAQAEELAPQIQAADPLGTAWARHFDENLPAKAARACGARRFEAVASSDFFQAVQIPVGEAGRSLVQCMRSTGGGYLRFATLDRKVR